MHMLSPDGISHTFDDRANGYGRGDGIASLVLKRLCDAIRDGDTIRAVIRGTGVNADGKTPSVTQPSAKAQADLINQTYEDAGLDQSDTGYFECHGTGTPVGDPLELTAIATTIGAARRSAGKSPLPIGSIKPTVGHTEGCAGLAGVFKAILLLEKGMLVPTYGVQSVNPKLKLDDWHLTLPQSLVKWPTTELRRASVNSFGFGGANAHAILDDAYHYCQQRGLVGDHNTTIPRPDLAERTDDGQETDVTIGAFKQLFLFTGKDKSGAQRVADRLNTWLQNEAMENNTKNLAYTLAMRRTHLEHRAFTVARSRSELTERLAKGLPAAIRSQRYGNNLVMIFTGQGAQWAGMGRELLEIPAFRRSIETSQSYLKALGCRWDATEELTNTNNTKINLPEYSQPLCTVVQIALVDILRSWKILPTATIGHSSGEIAAAYAAALLSQHDAVKLAYFRGLSSSAVSRKGAMMAVGLAQDEAQKYLENVPPGSAVVACINSPSSVTLSGDVEAIDQLEILISRDGKFARKLEVVTAYHSPHMKEVSGTYLQSIGDIVPLQRHTVGDAPVMYSSLTGCIISSAEELNAQYWVDNMQNPVQFSQALLALLKHRKANPDSHRQVLVQWGGLLEVGPHAALQGPLRQTIDTGSNQFAKSAPYISMLFRGKDASETSLTAAGVLWSAGYNVDLNAVNNFAASNRSGMLVMALEGALLTADSSKTVKGFRMNDVMFARGMVISLDDSAPVETRLSFHPHSTKPGSFEFSIFSMTNGPPWAVVPYSIDEIYVALDQPKEPGTLYSGYGRLLSHRGREITSELVVSDQEWSEPKLTIKNFGLRQVTSDKAGHVTTTTNKTNSKMIKNCANISWVPDLEFLADGGDLTKLILSGTEAYPMDTWLDAIFLKQANSTALIILFDESERNVEILVRLKTRTYGPSKIFAFATSQPGSEVMRAALGASSENLNISYDWLPTSQIFQKLAPEANDLVIALGVPDIANNAAILTRLSPLACLTYIKEPSEEDIVLSGRTCVSRLEEDKICFLFATRTSPDLTELPSSIVLLLPAQPSDNLSTLANMIQARLDGFGTSVTQSGLSASSIASLGGKSVISLLEIDSPLVYEWNEEQFSAFKDLVSTVRHLFWIARGSVLESWSGGVEFATSQGLFRVMRNEYPMAILPSLNLSAVAEICNAKYADLVLDVWRASLDEHGEMEYVEANGLIYVPRATENAGFDYELQLASNTASPTLAALDVSGEPLKASQSPDSRDCIWIPDDEANSPLGADEVEVNVECAGLGSGSTLDSVRHAVGIVTRRGDSVTAFELGQHVIVFSTAAARTHIRQNQAMVVSKPDYLEPHDAVALVEPVVTAQYALIELARLSQGQLCLFDNAGSAVGQALMQVAKAVGSDMFALVHNKAERDLIVDRFAIPTDHVFDSALNNFVPLIESAINQRGIDVFVSQHSGTHIAGAVSIMSAFGHFVDITTEGPRVSLPSASNITLTRVDVKAVVKGRKNVVSRLFQQAFTEYSLQGPSHMVAIPATNLPAVLNNVRAEQTVITLHDATPVLMPPPPARELELDGQATYVLVGGLGALGLEIAGWMVNCGAKHLVFLSRAGGSKNHDDLQRLSERFVQAEAYKCDVNDAASVARVFDTLKVGGKRIAGVVQLAMVLQDCIFENMSFRQWRNAISPKTEGSWNLLANISPGDKSFFILLSSITGVIGNKAQANYASGNTFEDALAHYARTHLGINATSIDVGLVSDSSHFTTAGAFGDLESYVRRYQHGWRGLQTNLTELGVVMRAIMRGSTTNGQEAPAQLVLGLGDGIKHNESMGGFSRDKKFQLRVVGKGDEAEGVDAKQDVGALLSNATTMLEATAVVEDNIKEMIAASMSIGIEEIDPQKPLFEYGGKSSLSLFENAFNISLTPVVDSLQAVEIRNRAQKFMRSDISVFDILSAMPLADVSAKISARSQLVKVTDSEE
ncbi:hypothetical protein SNOG_12897 [Parastagonospora nodorum SN15]|uniref:Ketosynthase family 3 (KS3) domain-containing protein n=1 Tax=Phaeosphaeria nodorum (strain SN15 / ATCC MYA-4574 / FGSC 10173) TaxID=321614 RepID=Q0U5R7_PHANO|nr:hypothetical protein SNOG_12897 [Parastagonospora nodorum SN15]EAT79697.2 hypothetical protein SNOG_12897 [Parastagonospora nodorum SN15]